MISLERVHLEARARAPSRSSSCHVRRAGYRSEILSVQVKVVVETLNWLVDWMYGMNDMFHQDPSTFSNLVS